MRETFSKLSASEQLAREISDEIRRGTWAAGTKLPSMRKLASRYGVGASTDHKAIANPVAEAMQQEIGLDLFADDDGNLMLPSDLPSVKTHCQDDAAKTAESIA